jgi:hypothetical protein
VTPNWITQIVQSYTTDDTWKELLSKLAIDATAKPNYKLINGII